MSVLKTDLRQHVHRAYQDQLVKQQDHVSAGVEKKANESQADVLISSINAELVAPLRLMPTQPTADRIVHVGPAITTNSVNARRKSIAPIGDTVPDFNGSTITLPTTVGGMIVNSAGSNVVLSMAAGVYKKCIVSLGADGAIYINLGADGATENLATIPAPGIIDGAHCGYFVIRSDGGGNILPVDHDHIFQFSSAGGGAGAATAIGAARNPADGFKALIFDSFDVTPSAPESKVDTITNATYDAANLMYEIQCDKTPLITITGTSFSLSVAPIFTIAPNDIIWVQSLNKFATIVSLSTQQTGILDYAIGNVAGAAGMVSQAVWTKDLVNYGDVAQETRLRDFYPAQDVTVCHIEYTDSLLVGDVVPDFTQQARIVVSAANEGVQAAFDYPTSDKFSPYFERPVSPDQWLDYSLLAHANQQRLFLVFFCNPGNASVLSSSNLISFDASLYAKELFMNGGVLDSSYCMSDGTGTPNNCSNPTVVSGKTRVQLNWSFAQNVNPGRPDGDIEVRVEGQIIPRWYSGVVGAYWKEVAGSPNLVEMWTNLSIYNYSIHIVRRQGVLDSSDQNAIDIATINAQLPNMPPIGTIVAWSGGYFTSTNNGGSFILSLTSNVNNVAAVNAYLAANSPSWKVCDGTAPNVAQSPIFNVAGRYLPNLTDNRFLQGSTVAGSSGGQNSTTLSISDLPAHSHTINHTHGSSAVSGTFSGTAASSGTHNHGITDPSHTHNIPTYNGTAGSFEVGTGDWGADYLPAIATSSSTTGITINSDGAHTHTVSGTISGTADGQSYSGSSGSVGSATAIENRPQYLNVFYIMKIM